MDDFLMYKQCDEISFLDYIAYLEANGLELDENGNEVPKEKNMSLNLTFNGDIDE